MCCDGGQWDPHSDRTTPTTFVCLQFRVASAWLAHPINPEGVGSAALPVRGGGRACERVPRPLGLEKYAFYLLLAEQCHAEGESVSESGCPRRGRTGLRAWRHRWMRGSAVCNGQPAQEAGRQASPRFPSVQRPRGFVVRVGDGVNWCFRFLNRTQTATHVRPPAVMRLVPHIRRQARRPVLGHHRGLRKPQVLVGYRRLSTHCVSHARRSSAIRASPAPPPPPQKMIGDVQFLR